MAQQQLYKSQEQLLSSQQQLYQQQTQQPYYASYMHQSMEEMMRMQ